MTGVDPSIARLATEQEGLVDRRQLVTPGVSAATGAYAAAG